jgi:hypothetical protein
MAVAVYPFSVRIFNASTTEAKYISLPLYGVDYLVCCFDTISIAPRTGGLARGPLNTSDEHSKPKKVFDLLHI